MIVSVEVTVEPPVVTTDVTVAVIDWPPVVSVSVVVTVEPPVVTVCVAV